MSLDVRLKLQIEALGLTEMYSLLCQAYGRILDGRYAIERLLAVGHRNILFRASDLERGVAVVAKMPAFDYCHPVKHSILDVAQKRQALKHEFEVLTRLDSPWLPKPHKLLTVRSPVPFSEESEILAAGEVILIQEYIDGKSLRDLCLGDWQALGPVAREVEVCRACFEFLQFWETLREAGYFYSDVSATNILQQMWPSRATRVVDAGSVSAVGRSFVLKELTPSFASPRLHEAAAAGRLVPTQISTVLPMVGKLVHFLLTTREPLNGLIPETTIPELGAYSRESVAVIEAFVALDEHPELLPEAVRAFELWRAQLGLGAASMIGPR